MASTYASIDYEHTLSGKTTKATVSGETMKNSARNDSTLVLSAGASKRVGHWILGAQSSLHNTGVSAQVNVGIMF
ncbi:MAG: hypothetical protein F4X93_02295 [Proteobacteria bacterium]|nr:hypothetical protein [Pseudomonadota bacterium]